MIYLILAILTSAMISVIMRIGTDRGARNMTMFAVNYLVGSALSFFYIKGAAVSSRAAAGSSMAWKAGMNFAVLIGLIGAALVLLSI